LERGKNDPLQAPLDYGLKGPRFLSIISFVQVLKLPKLPATKKDKLSQMDNLAIYKTVNRMALLLYSNFNIYNRSKKIWRE
ncbi:hypothetical protein, partial [Allobaculum fili]|uniref:hypothetical protein n=1 Tax=Allobaculum fili TaxID=2834460 RepID=UPI001E43212E